MKKYVKSFLSFAVAFAMFFSIVNIPVFTFGAGQLIKYAETVELSDNAFDNFYTLSNTIAQADETHMLTVKIAKPGKYKISSDGSAIMMRSNTILDLNGSTLIRSGNNINNLFQNEDFEGNRDNGGYNQTYNFGIKNGTLDGSGGSLDEQNLVNFGHANNITLENINFKNCKNSHLVELTGCKNATVKGCTFTGFSGSGKSGDYTVKEALQLDICHKSDITWNGTYKLDDTVCKDITVENCVFKDYPSGVGNHHTLVGTKKHNSNIKIKNNKFINTLSEKGYAIWCFGFEKSLVSGNTISGNYETAIMISAGSVTVSGNTVSNVSYAPIYVTKSTSSASGSKTKEETANSCVIKNNTFTTKGNYDAVSVYSGSKLLELQGNKIGSEKKSAVYCSGKGSSIKTLKNNTITKAGEYGIAVANKAKIDTVNKNTVTGKKAGIRVTSGALIKNIKDNKKITSASGEAIWVSDSKITNITSNTVNSSASYGIGAASKAQIDSISKNSISAKKAGVRVTSGASVKDISGNKKITSTSEDGIMISGAGVTNIDKNTIKNCGANGIFVSSTGKVSKIEANTVSGNKGYGVRVNNKSTVYLGLNKYSKNKSGNEKVTAKIKKIYVVTYKLNGGTNNKNNPESFTADTPTITLKNPTRKGYTFKGWYNDSKFKTKVTKIPKGSKKDKTLYAKWKK